MGRRSAASPFGAARALLAVAALLLGVLAPSASASATAALAPHVGLPHSAAPCAAECDRTPLLHRAAAPERHAPHPAGAAVTARARLSRPAAGIRPPALPPDAPGRPARTAHHQGRAPPPPPGS